jgi:hypothetical protein
METYNGWRNYDTWQANLVLDNTNLEVHQELNKLKAKYKAIIDESKEHDKALGGKTYSFPTYQIEEVTKEFFALLDTVDFKGIRSNVYASEILSVLND